MKQEPVLPIVGLILMIGVMGMLYRAQPPARPEKKEYLETNLEEE